MTDADIALVTGSGRGIGAAIVTRFLKDGYTVVGCDVGPNEGEPEGERHRFVACDVTREEQVAELVASTLDQYRNIDVLVNNAGVVLVKPLEETSWGDYRRVVDTNLGGTVSATKHVLPAMKERQRGSIVNLASVSGHVGQVDHAVYGATKGAILSLTRALAWELAPYSIRVNSISPGSVDTPMLRGDVEIESARTGDRLEDVKARREAEQAFGRWADPSEIAEVVLFLASERASFITGTDVLVDCGWVAK